MTSFFFPAPAPTEIYTLSLHDALPICDIEGIAYTAGPGLVGALLVGASCAQALAFAWDIPSIGVHHMEGHLLAPMLDRKSTRLNSSHVRISYAVFCLKKKKTYNK